MNWFEASDSSTDGIGNSRPPGPAQLTDHLEPGLAVLRFVYDSMRIDEEWSVREDRGFTWWGHQHAQRVWVEPGFDDEGIVVYRLRVETEVVRHIDFDGPQLELVNAFNMLAVTSALVPAPADTVLRYAASMWVHAGSVAWVANLLKSVVAIQAVHAESQGELLAKALGGGTPAISAHPASGVRPTPDAMLSVMGVITGAGSEPSWWAGPEMQAALTSLGQMPSTLLATGDERGLTAEFPHPAGTSLLQAKADEPHPALGNGMLVRLSLPDRLDDSDGPGWAAEMNRRELNSLVRAHSIGAWVIRSGTPTHVSFYPNFVKYPDDGELFNLLLTSVNRARWIADGFPAG